MFSETYEDYIDVVAGLSREGDRYGIQFVITATGVNSIRGKTSQNFSKQICLNFNDPTDYSNILGTTHGMIPSDILGRGLMKIKGEIYEFQTAYPYKWDDINNFIKNTCYKLNETIKVKAPQIAILPEHVRYENISNKITDIKNVPIGIEKTSLEVSTFNFSKNPISLISAQDASFLDEFVSSLGQVIQKINNTELYIIDPNETIKEPNTFKNYYSTNYQEIITKLNEINNNNNGKTNIFLINGLDMLRNNLSIDDQNTLNDILLGLKQKQHIKVIISDSISKIKNFEYDEFYRENIQPIYGIWIGSGITEQYTLKSSTYTKETRSQIENDFGYNINRGTATLIKLLDFYSKD